MSTAKERTPRQTGWATPNRDSETHRELPVRTREDRHLPSNSDNSGNNDCRKYLIPDKQDSHRQNVDNSTSATPPPSVDKSTPTTLPPLGFSNSTFIRINKIKPQGRIRVKLPKVDYSLPKDMRTEDTPVGLSRPLGRSELHQPLKNDETGLGGLKGTEPDSLPNVDKQRPTSSRSSAQKISDNLASPFKFNPDIRIPDLSGIHISPRSSKDPSSCEREQNLSNAKRIFSTSTANSNPSDSGSKSVHQDSCRHSTKPLTSGDTKSSSAKSNDGAAGSNSDGNDVSYQLPSDGPGKHDNPEPSRSTRSGEPDISGPDKGRRGQSFHLAADGEKDSGNRNVAHSGPLFPEEKRRQTARKQFGKLYKDDIYHYLSGAVKPLIGAEFIRLGTILPLIGNLTGTALLEATLRALEMWKNWDNKYRRRLDFLGTNLREMRERLPPQDKVIVEEINMPHIIKSERWEDLEHWLQAVQGVGEHQLRRVLKLALECWGGETCLGILREEIEQLTSAEVKRLKSEAQNPCLPDRFASEG